MLLCPFFLSPSVLCVISHTFNWIYLNPGNSEWSPHLKILNSWLRGSLSKYSNTRGFLGLGRRHIFWGSPVNQLHRMIPFIWNAEKCKLVLARGQDWRKGLLRDFKETFGDDDRVHSDCGDGFTGVHICHNLSNCVIYIFTAYCEPIIAYWGCFFQVYETFYWNFDLEFYLSLIPAAFSTSVPSKFLIHSLMLQLAMARYFGHIQIHVYHGHLHITDTFCFPLCLEIAVENTLDYLFTHLSK